MQRMLQRRMKCPLSKTAVIGAKKSWRWGVTSIRDWKQGNRNEFINESLNGSLDAIVDSQSVVLGIDVWGVVEISCNNTVKKRLDAATRRWETELSHISTWRRSSYSRNSLQPFITSLIHLHMCLQNVFACNQNILQRPFDRLFSLHHWIVRVLDSLNRLVHKA